MKFKNISLNKLIFLVVMALTVLVIINGSYLPMVDLPQHAAQVSALDLMIKDESPWANLIELNFKTPYLVGYFSWLILYQFFDIVFSSRILVSSIFIFFIFSFNSLRKELGASPIVTWIAVPSFFGFSYEWGFITFLLAVAIGNFFFLYNIKWAENRKPKNAIIVTILGLVLFFSHILSFLFFCLLSFIYFCVVLKRIKIFFYFLPSYFFFASLIVFYLNQKDSLVGKYDYGINIKFHNLAERIDNLLTYPWGMAGDYTVISLLLLILPFMMGFKFSKIINRYVPIFVFALTWLLLPHFFNNTYFIYERYSILFFGFYYIIFEPRENFKYQKIFTFFLLIPVLFFLSQDYKSILIAKKENQDFEKLIEILPGKKRVLGLIFEPTSLTIGIPFTYVHFGSWYQAQKAGWSDFNFAWFHPQVVRYIPSMVPEVRPGFEWMPMSLIQLENCKQYDLLVVRAYDLSFTKVILSSQCKDYKLIEQRGVWFVLSKVN